MHRRHTKTHNSGDKPKRYNVRFP